MNYDSISFWLMFAALMVPYWSLSRTGQNRLLLLASYVFYGSWDYRLLFLILLSTYIDFVGGLGVAGVRRPLRQWVSLTALMIGAGLVLDSGIRYDFLWEQKPWDEILPRRLVDFAPAITALCLGLATIAAQSWLFSWREQSRRKAYLMLTLAANLGILGYFKYCNFFYAQFVSLLESLHLGQFDSHTLGILLPAGISFYTFQSMSYVVDVYRKETEPTDDFADFALFVSFFPHLVAGPIMRASTLLPQVLQPRRMNPQDWEDGLYLVIIGMFKKLVIADNLAPIVNALFHRFYADSTTPGTGFEALVAVYAFAFQIYADFSGYSSVARGISKWVGFELVVNFDQPYFAVSPSDFWRRWHISLSTWLRDYLYIPLGGNRCGVWRNYFNLILTMVLGGLWHGANWTFIAWGFYHGALLCLFRGLGIRDPRFEGSVAAKVYFALRVVLMFHLTCLGWLLFRAETFAVAQTMLQALFIDFAPSVHDCVPLILILIYCGPIFMLERILAGENRLPRLTASGWMIRGVVYSYFLAMILIFQAEEASEFIYFQF